jgi:hypothetical protein
MVLRRNGVEIGNSDLGFYESRLLAIRGMFFLCVQKVSNGSSEIRAAPQICGRDEHHGENVPEGSRLSTTKEAEGRPHEPVESREPKPHEGVEKLRQIPLSLVQNASK